MFFVWEKISQPRLRWKSNNHTKHRQSPKRQEVIMWRSKTWPFADKKNFLFYQSSKHHSPDSNSETNVIPILNFHPQTGNTPWATTEKAFRSCHCFTGNRGCNAKDPKAFPFARFAALSGRDNRPSFHRRPPKKLPANKFAPLRFNCDF